MYSKARNGICLGYTTGIKGVFPKRDLHYIESLNVSIFINFVSQLVITCDSTVASILKDTSYGSKIR